jgi:carbamoyl-phosphate synthase large subunit
MKEKILVTGVGGSAGRATTAFFRQRNFAVVGTDCVNVESEADEFHIVPRGDDPGFAHEFLRLISTEKPTIVIPTVSEELPGVARLKTSIRKCESQIFISDPDVVDLVNDKLTTAIHLRENGVKVPRTVASGGRPVATTIRGEVGYPCIVKPRVGRGGKGVALYRYEAEALRDVRPDVVWQEFMPGEEFDVNLFAYPAGHVRSLAVLQKLTMKQGVIGNAVSVQRVIHRDVAELGIRVAAILALEGPIEMDVRRDGNGVARLLEVNGRVGATVLSAPEILEELLATAFAKN